MSRNFSHGDAEPPMIKRTSIRVGETELQLTASVRPRMGKLTFSALESEEDASDLDNALQFRSGLLQRFHLGKPAHLAEPSVAWNWLSTPSLAFDLTSGADVVPVPPFESYWLSTQWVLFFATDEIDVEDDCFRVAVGGGNLSLLVRDGLVVGCAAQNPFDSLFPPEMEGRDLLLRNALSVWWLGTAIGGDLTIEGTSAAQRALLAVKRELEADHSEPARLLRQEIDRCVVSTNTER